MIHMYRGVGRVAAAVEAAQARDHSLTKPFATVVCGSAAKQSMSRETLENHRRDCGGQPKRTGSEGGGWARQGIVGTPVTTSTAPAARYTTYTHFCQGQHNHVCCCTHRKNFGVMECVTALRSASPAPSWRDLSPKMSFRNTTVSAFSFSSCSSYEPHHQPRGSAFVSRHPRHQPA
jgi:hypothetical protein